MRDDREELYEELLRYYPAVVSQLRKLGFDHEDARDLAQEVFCRVYEHMDAYRAESKLVYLQTVTRRLAYNELRDRHAAKRQGIHVDTNEVVDLQDGRDEAADQRLERHESLQRLRVAVSQLPPNEREAIRLQLSELPLEEIAKAIGITVSALKSRLHTARKRLRDVLGETEGLGGPDDH